MWRSFGSSLAVTHSVLHSSCVDGSYNCRRRTTSVAGASSPGGGTGGRQHAVFYCPRPPRASLPPSLPPLLAFQSSKSDERRVRLRLLFSVRGGSSPASLVVPFGPPATATAASAAVPPKEISAAGVGWEMGSHDRAAAAFSPSLPPVSPVGARWASLLRPHSRRAVGVLARPSVTASRVPNPLGGAFLIVLYRGRMDRSSDRGSDSVRPSLRFPAALAQPRPATLPPSPLHHNP